LALIKAKKQIDGFTDLSHDSVPACPVCGKMMVLRTYRSGPKKGQLFYGCIDNPKCLGTLSIKNR
jgi:ssDNA-binding Zn-finger/Zn-ribbon topoisomerase 1